ncbi:tetratricopeptide repeat protein [Streptomyces sp. NPDC088921]|uniref:SEL1-like repeat protein n=1 Tax=unclassified Streptomyces TaxID=2593676 RepID=UPI00343413A3
MSQKKLAEASGVPNSTLGGWATGIAAPRDLDQLVKVGDTLARWAKERGHSARAWDAMMAADRRRSFSAQAPEQVPAASSRDSWLAVGTWRTPPRLADLTDQELGASPNRYSERGNAPYVPRSELDDELDALLTDPVPSFPVLLVWGRTKSGKTRMVVEALRRNLPGHTRVIVPALSAEIPAGFFEQITEVPDVPVVLWLDDPDVSQLARLDRGRLAQVRDAAIVVITISARSRAALYDTTSRQAVGYMPVLEAATQLEVPFENTSEELQQARAAYPEEPIIGNIAETLSSARILLARYRSAEEHEPVACAVVRAAVDLRRMGLGAGIDEPMLVALAADHLADLAPNITLDDQLFQSAMAWASTPVASSAALLYRRRGLAAGHWLVFDHLLTADDGELDYRRRPLPDRLWPAAIAAATHDQAVSIGFTALQQDILPAAELAWRRAAEHTDPWRSMLALNQLLATLTRLGSEEQANEIRDKLAELHPHFVVNRLYEEGVELATSSDFVEARRRFEQVVSTGLPLHGWMAHLNLSMITWHEGDSDQAENYFGIVMSCGIQEPASRSAFLLGAIAKDRGEIERARDLWRWATAWSPPRRPRSSESENPLAKLSEQHIELLFELPVGLGQVFGGVEAPLVCTHSFALHAGPGETSSMYTPVSGGPGSFLPTVWQGNIEGTLGEEIRFTNFRYGPANAYLYLGRLSREHDDDGTAAAEHFQQVLRFSEYPSLVSAAELELGLLSELAGDPGAAAEHYRKVSAAGDLDDSVTAVARLAGLAQIDPAEATSQLRQRASLEDVLDAWFDQVNSSISQGQWQLAEIGLRQAISLLPPNDVRHTKVLREFGSEAIRGGETERGRKTLREAADAGDAQSMRLLALSYRDDEPERFAEWMGRAAEQGHRLAMYWVGCEADRVGDFEGATRWLRRASDAGYVIAARALARVYSDAGDGAESERYLAKAATEGNPAAMRQLARLLVGRGEDGPAQLWMLRAVRRRLMAGTEDDESVFPDADPNWSVPWEEAVRAWLSATTWEECEAALAAHPVLAGEAGFLYAAERLATEPEDSEFTQLTILQGILMLGRDGDTEEGFRVATDGNHAVHALLAALTAGEIPTVVGVCNAGLMTFDSDDLLGPLTSLVVLTTSLPADTDAPPQLEQLLEALRSAALAADPDWLATLRKAVAGCINEGDSWRAIHEAIERPATKYRGFFRSRHRG